MIYLIIYLLTVLILHIWIWLMYCTGNVKGLLAFIKNYKYRIPKIVIIAMFLPGLNLLLLTSNILHKLFEILFNTTLFGLGRPIAKRKSSGLDGFTGDHDGGTI